MQDLPDQIFDHIFSYLQLPDVIRCKLLGKKFNHRADSSNLLINLINQELNKLNETISYNITIATSNNYTLEILKKLLVLIYLMNQPNLYQDILNTIFFLKKNIHQNDEIHKIINIAKAKTYIDKRYYLHQDEKNLESGLEILLNWYNETNDIDANFSISAYYKGLSNIHVTANTSENIEPESVADLPPADNEVCSLMINEYINKALSLVDENLLNEVKDTNINLAVFAHPYSLKILNALKKKVTDNEYTYFHFLNLTSETLNNLFESGSVKYLNTLIESEQNKKYNFT